MSKSDSIVAELRQHLVPILLRRSSDTSQLSKDGTRITSTPQVSPQVLAHRSRSDIPSSLQQSKSQDLKDSSLEEAIPPNIDEQPVSTHSSTTPIESEQFEKPVLTLERPTPEDDQIPVSRAIIRHTAPVEQHIPNGSTGNPLIEGLSKSTTTTESIGYFAQPAIIMSTQIILHKRVWVKRQGASATLVQISEEDLVDDVREKILKKYANSLGRTFDSPDVTIRIVPRLDSHGHFERSLGPEESVATALNQYYPTGQTIDEALIIDIPHRRTPRQSPRVYMDHHRPSENGGDYFSVMPVALNHSPHLHTLPQQPIHTISVLNTGQLPTVPLPSPGAVSRRHASYRPKYGRTTTSSPTAITTNISHTNPLQGM